MKKQENNKRFYGFKSIFKKNRKSESVKYLNEASESSTNYYNQPVTSKMLGTILIISSIITILLLYKVLEIFFEIGEFVKANKKDTEHEYAVVLEKVYGERILGEEVYYECRLTGEYQQYYLLESDEEKVKSYCESIILDKTYSFEYERLGGFNKLVYVPNKVYHTEE